MAMTFAPESVRGAAGDGLVGLFELNLVGDTVHFHLGEIVVYVAHFHRVEVAVDAILVFFHDLMLMNRD